VHRQPTLARGRAWRVLLAALILTGLGIWSGGHCTDHAAVEQAAAITSVAGDGHHQVAAVAAVAVPRVAVPRVAVPRVAVPRVAVPHTAAGDCHLVTATTPAVTAGVANASPPIRHQAGGVVVGDAAPRPVPRLLTSRPLTEIGVSRT